MFTTNLSDKNSSYENLLESLDSIHHKNIIQALAIEIFKIKRKLCLLLVIFLWKGQTTSIICVIVLIL